MGKEISLTEIQPSGDPAFRYAMMRKVIEAVRKEGELYMPLLNLVTTFIDGLASGQPGGTKTAYMNYLQTQFPELCAAIGAEVFYTNYRCGAVHEFNLKKGFGIERGEKMPGTYVDTKTIRETGGQMTILNIDRLIDDFILHVRSLERSIEG
jgi:hypothetical protein